MTIWCPKSIQNYLLLLSHQLQSLGKLSDKVIWRGRGQVVEFGETSSVLDAYRNAKARWLDRMVDFPNGRVV